MKMIKIVFQDKTEVSTTIYDKWIAELISDSGKRYRQEVGTYQLHAGLHVLEDLTRKSKVNKTIAVIK